MNTRIFLSTGLLLAALPLSAAERAPEPPVPVIPATPRPAPEAAPGTDYEQRLYGPAGTLVAPEKAQQVVEAFRGAYGRLGKPRVLLYVNRALVDEESGLQLSGRKEQVSSARSERRSEFQTDPNAPAPASGSAQTQVNVALGGDAGNAGQVNPPGKGSGEERTERVNAENTYRAGERARTTLADQQTAREIERLFGRPLRVAGTHLADQRVAAQLIADKPIDHFVAPANEAARKDREALAKIADVVVEILVSSRNLAVPQIASTETLPAPDIQVTAIRLSDSQIIGQASSSDILGKDRDAGRILRRFDARDITEATALALMEDITLTAPAAP